MGTWYGASYVKVLKLTTLCTSSGGYISWLLHLNFQEGEELQGALNAKEMENQTLKHQIMNLTREINKFRLQPPVDVSIIEILKQQIQVCTEDFNTERKDREHAVNKAKQLQDELNRVFNEVSVRQLFSLFQLVVWEFHDFWKHDMLGVGITMVINDL